MPWKPSDATDHKKGLTEAQKKKWAKIANGVLKDTGSEAQAIKIANASVKKKKK